VTPEQFEVVAIAAIERQIAAGSRLTQGDWGQPGPGKDGCPLACGCALTLTVQDSDPAVASEMAMIVDEPSVLAARCLGISHSQAIKFVAGFDGASGTGPWHQAGADVAARFAQVAS